jgi:preprotein translocase subunit SecA
MRIFGSERISGLMLKLGMEEGVPIEHGLVTRSIERAQRQVEAQNFAVRKHLLEYDDVMNKQRTAVYDMRRMVLEGKNTREHVLGLSRDVVEWYLDNYASEKQDPGEWNLDGLHLALKETFGLDLPATQLSKMGRQELAERLSREIEARYVEKERLVGPDLMLFHQRMIMLQIVDSQWKDHLYSLDHLKEGIGLRGYGQRDPLVEYKKESFAMFQALMDRIDEEILRWIFLYQPVPVSDHPTDEEPPAEAAREPRAQRPRGLGPSGAAVPPGGGNGSGLALGKSAPLPRNLSFNDPAAAPSAFARAQPREAEGGSGEVQTIRREGKKVGRNDPCPCGSGKKYKKCHGGG